MTVEHETQPTEVEAEDLTGFDVDPDDVGDDATGDNFRKLRTSRDQWQARAEAAEAAARRGVLIEAGFLPDSGEGKALLRAIAAGEVEADPGALAAHAEEEYGWQPAIFYSGIEATQVQAAERQQALAAATTSDQSGPVDAEYEKNIADARGDGDFTTASRLQREYDRKRGS